MRRILSISYDPSLSGTRSSLLISAGYDVASALNLEMGLEFCRTGGFDLLILGHSIPDGEKKALLEEFRKHSSAPVLTLLLPGQDTITGFEDFLHSLDGPAALIDKVHKIFAARPPRATSSAQ